MHKIQAVLKFFLACEDKQASKLALMRNPHDSWCFLLAHVLRDFYGYQIAIAEEFRPEFVLLDIGIPKLNGFETAKRIRSESWSRGTALIALSGHRSKDYQRLAREAGFNRYLLKPVPVKTIVALIEKDSQVDGDGQTAFDFICAKRRT